MDSDLVQSLLVIVVDTNPVWWGQQDPQKELTLPSCMHTVSVFANSHLMLGSKNRVAVLAAHSDHSVFLYNDKLREEQEKASSVAAGGQYEQFHIVEQTIRHSLTSLVLNDDQKLLHSDCLLAGALLKALCYIHRVESNLPTGQILSSRILVIKCSEDNPSQYMNLMNAVFSAQKHSVLIDACILGAESGLLQQACDITGGIYLKVPQSLGLLQYLYWVFLAEVEARKALVLPPKAQVDYRAACFCDRQLLDIGYVCSVCLSIFCKFSPICSTCNAKFKFMGPARVNKKKSKT